MRTPLTRERILAAALRLVERGGIDGLSMRKLGAALHVDPMAIYHHLPGKDAVLDALVESVFRSMPVPSPRGGWKRRVRVWADAYRTIAAAHRGLVLEILTRPAVVATAAATANRALDAALRDAGLSPRAIESATIAIVDYVNGSVLAGAVVDETWPEAFGAGLDVIIAGIGTMARER